MYNDPIERFYQSLLFTTESEDSGASKLLISKFGNATMSQIVKYENAIGTSLPQQYKTFIKKYNGGVTPSSYFNINGVSSDLRGFYGIGKVKYSLNSKRPKMIDGSKYLPIAMDTFGNDILINLDKGEIFFKDHETGNMKKLASSLKEFINKCKSDVPDNKAKSIEERERDLISRGRGDTITDSLRDMWKTEIEKHSTRSYEVVTL